MGNGFRLKLVLSRGLDLSEQGEIAKALNNYPECLIRRVSDDCPHFSSVLKEKEQAHGKKASHAVRNVGAEADKYETAVSMWFPSMAAACASAARLRQKVGRMNAAQTNCNSS